MIEKFQLTSLAVLDQGRVREAFEQAMRRLEADCKDRPNDPANRKVSLHMTMVPVANESGELESCNVQFQIVDQIPKRKTKVYNMKSTRGGLVFNELSPEDIRQGTLDDVPAPRSAANAR